MPRRPLPWPASRLDRDIMHELYLEAKSAGQPMTAIIAAALAEHCNRRLHQTASSAPPATDTGGAAAAA
ncbi:MAG: hypothetical protein J0M02_01260 [Planctomycetes bacterium]|nr:hypothetical protein [Planctomycetota bacterium]